MTIKAAGSVEPRLTRGGQTRRVAWGPDLDYCDTVN